MQPDALEGGFANPPLDAARAFRRIMNAMARPGRIETVAGARPPAPVSGAAGTAMMTLCDGDTPIYLAGDANSQAMRDWIAFHLGAPLSGPADCAFALGSWDALLPLHSYPIGTPEYPDRSATLIIEMAELTANGVHLSGPGIKDVATLSLPDPEAMARNAQLFPLGLDFFFTCGDRIAALPRSTRIASAVTGKETT